GTVVPASIGVKRAEARALGLGWGLGCARGLYEWFVRDFGVGGLALVALAVYGFRLRQRATSSGIERLLLVAVVPLGFYPLAGVTFAPWYFVLPLLVMLLLTVLPVAAAFAEGAIVRLGVAMALLAAAMSGSAAWLIDNADRPPHPRMGEYMEIGRWIAAHSDAGDSIAAVEAGFLSFASDRPIVDLLGLGSPGGLEAFESGELEEFFFARSPAFFIRHPTFDELQSDILRDRRFAERYVLAAVVSSAGDASVEVYQARRRGIPARIERLTVAEGEGP
ncbi:MAG: hypothetical protein ACREQ9_19850, partial [Candidatus Binatia bacterium]